VQGYNKRDDAFFQQYHAETKTQGDFNEWAQRWVNGVADRAEYANQLGRPRVAELGVKQHAYAARTDYGY
jgi:glutaconate CoA-transferase subunit A